MTNQEKDKTRVYEYAKSLNMSSKEIITILKRLDIPVNNHMSVMENETVNAVEKFFRDIKANAAAKRAAEAGNNQTKSQTNIGVQTSKPARPTDRPSRVSSTGAAQQTQTRPSTPASSNNPASTSHSNTSQPSVNRGISTDQQTSNTRPRPSNPSGRPQGTRSCLRLLSCSR